MSPASDPFLASQGAAPGWTREQLRKEVKSVASHPNVALVTGAVQFPLLCPNCGAAAGRTLEVKRAVKTYTYNEDSPNETDYEVVSFAVPFCEACIQRHFAAASAPSPWLTLKRLFLGPGAGQGLGAAIVLGVALFFLKDGIVNLTVAPVVMSLLPGSVAFFLLRKNWKANEHMSVSKGTDVTSAVEFTPNLGLAYEPAWRAFRFRDAGFASQFRTVNAGRVWDPQGQQAQEARAKRRAKSGRMNRLAIAAVVAVILFGLWSEYGPDLLDLLDRLR